jgi:histone acetyltransferase MYST1
MSLEPLHVMDAQSETVVPNVNDHCSVKWIRDSSSPTNGVSSNTTAEGTAPDPPLPLTLEAVVVERRPLQRVNPNKRLPVGAVEGLGADEIEYYVHYVGHDRRLDQWLTLDRFELETLQQGTPEAMNERLVRQKTMNGTSDGATDTVVTNLTISHTLTDDSTSAEFAPVYVGGGNFHGDLAGEKQHEEATKVKNIERIIMGGWEVESWYYSPFPEDYSNIGTLYVCEYCLAYMRKTRTYLQHKETCQCHRPPGTEIYREADIAVYELDGKSHPAYCQKLCLIAKLFLDHKTLYYDTTPFYFYIVTKVDEEGSHIVGYFSKEKVIR